MQQFAVSESNAFWVIFAKAYTETLWLVQNVINNRNSTNDVTLFSFWCTNNEITHSPLDSEKANWFDVSTGGYFVSWGILIPVNSTDELTCNINDIFIVINVLFCFTTEITVLYFKLRRHQLGIWWSQIKFTGDALADFGACYTS